jgi:hypothetical protein
MGLTLAVTRREWAERRHRRRGGGQRRWSRGFDERRGRGESRRGPAGGGTEEGVDGGQAMWPTRGGSGARAGGSLSTGRRRLAGSDPKPVSAGDVRLVHTTGRTEGEGRG